LGLDFGSFAQLLGSVTRKRYDIEKAHLGKGDPSSLACSLSGSTNPIIQKRIPGQLLLEPEGQTFR